MSSMVENADIIRIPNSPYPSVPVPEAYEDYRGKGTPLIIDNGSTNLRFGFATSSTPRSVTNIVSRYKDRKQNRPVMLLGDAIDAETGARAQARTPWEGDVLLNFDALVSLSSHLQTPKDPARCLHRLEPKHFRDLIMCCGYFLSCLCPWVGQ